MASPSLGTSYEATGQPQRESQVMSEMVKLRDQLGIMAKCVSQMEGRLGTVMRMEPPQPAGKEKLAGADLCQFAEMIRENNGILANCAMRMQSMLERIEL